MPGTLPAVPADSLSYPQKTGRLLAVLDEIAVVAGVAADVYTDPRDAEVLRARLREVAGLASRAADACK